MLILNAFSINMVAHFPATISVDEISLATVRDLVSYSSIDSAVGHTETAAIFSSLLGVAVPMQRRTVTLECGDVAIIGQYRGPRLPEGATTLPTDATIVWYRVAVS